MSLHRGNQGRLLPMPGRWHCPGALGETIYYMSLSDSCRNFIFLQLSQQYSIRGLPVSQTVVKHYCKSVAIRARFTIKAMGHCNHCLHHLLLPVKKVCYNLRTPSYELIVHKLKQTRCSYLVRMVFENVPV